MARMTKHDEMRATLQSIGVTWRGKPAVDLTDKEVEEVTTALLRAFIAWGQKVQRVMCQALVQITSTLNQDPTLMSRLHQVAEQIEQHRASH